MLALASIAALGLGATGTARADSCGTGVAYDYAAALEALPAPRAVPASGKLPFGPGSITLHSRTESLIVTEDAGLPAGGGGFLLFVPPRSGKFSDPDLPPFSWLVTAKLNRVDAGGRVGRLLDFRSRRIEGPDDPSGFALDRPGQVGFYRAEIVFRDGAGKRLGRFGQYFRVLPAVEDVRLTLNNTSFRPGETVSACLENFGTRTVAYGACGIAIMAMAGAAWEPLEPPHACPAIAFLLGPGRAVQIGAERIPEDARPGTYRAFVGAERWADFQVLPPSG